MQMGPVSSPFQFALPDGKIIPRGISPSVLLSHVQNSVPFLFDGDFGGIRVDANRAFVSELVSAFAKPDREMEHAAYFRLALAAHWATATSFLPTEVEAQIRFRLWHPGHPSDVLREMGETVLAAYAWDSTALSRRWVASPFSKFILSAHHGEWFTVAVAAYIATRDCDPFLSLRLREAIEYEVTREAKIYLEFRKARDGAGMLLAASLISHNLADLDRAIEIWNVPAADPLHEFAYHATLAEGARAARFGGALTEAGRMNKSLIGAESHRHFALSVPRSLRRAVDLLLPLAPFFDDWGRRVAAHPAIRREELADLVEALYTGWEKLKGSDGKTITYAYPRAVAGILEAVPGGIATLAPLLPLHIERNLRSGLFHSLFAVSESRFREQSAAQALGFASLV
jgi:hypothetical protein